MTRSDLGGAASQSTTSTRSTRGAPARRIRPAAGHRTPAGGGLRPAPVRLAVGLLGHQRVDDGFEPLARVGSGKPARASRRDPARHRQRSNGAKAARWRAWRFRLRPWSAREIASASMMAAPRARQHLVATVLLPLPMPPVRPRSRLRSCPAHRPTARRMDCGPKTMAVRPARQKGAERHIRRLRAAAVELHANADDRADHRGHQDDGHQRLPAKPGAQARRTA
jgi:hypothetical protein